MRIALCASAPSSRKLAPFGDDSWEIWSCSPPNYDLPRVDAWFELHALKRKIVQANAPYIEVLKQHPRVYMNAADPLFSQFPLATPFPFEELLKEFGPWFFSSSVAWMFAFAIMYKPEMIGLWGIDMAAAEEYEYQRPGLHFFIREAQKRGIQIAAPGESDILNHSPLYALKEQTPFYWKNKARKLELKDRVARAEQAIAQATHERDVIAGALDHQKYHENTYCPTRMYESEMLRNRLAQLEAELKRLKEGADV